MNFNKYFTYLLIFTICFITTHGFAQRNKDYKEIASQKQREGNFRAALKNYDKAIHRNPDDAEAYYHRGNVRYDLKDYKGAIEDCSQALVLNPSLINAYFNIAISKYHLRKYNEALKDFNQSLYIKPEDSEAYYWRGMTYFRLNEREKACKDWNRAKDLGNGYVNQYLTKYCKEEGGVEVGEH